MQQDHAQMVPAPETQSCCIEIKQYSPLHNQTPHPVADPAGCLACRDLPKKAMACPGFYHQMVHTFSNPDQAPGIADLF